ncbi:hypothetical protein RND71_015649 [Anisodus tanguticus]|uniref:Uncharacterized protein n=1 Tax=Anisodus tanguticus TaxID=243964 RepID=A0AAE1S6L5_9SOLA|nr:hypothetical protein RND71_015649 [Anisodus tanguticus]
MSEAIVTSSKLKSDLDDNKTGEADIITANIDSQPFNVTLKIASTNDHREWAIDDMR